jgi:N-methylhydantoinase B
MPEAVAAVRAHDPALGEPWILNDPYAGGTHLPDLTIVTRTGLGYAVTRAHHADVGGSEPGSLPAGSTTLEEEGVVIPDALTRDLDALSRRCATRRSAAATCGAAGGPPADEGASPSPGAGAAVIAAA